MDLEHRYTVRNVENLAQMTSAGIALLSPESRQPVDARRIRGDVLTGFAYNIASAIKAESSREDFEERLDGFPAFSLLPLIKDGHLTSLLSLTLSKKLFKSYDLTFKKVAKNDIRSLKVATRKHIESIKKDSGKHEIILEIYSDNNFSNPSTICVIDETDSELDLDAPNIMKYRTSVFGEVLGINRVKRIAYLRGDNANIKLTGLNNSQLKVMFASMGYNTSQVFKAKGVATYHEDSKAIVSLNVNEIEPVNKLGSDFLDILKNEQHVIDWELFDILEGNT